MPQVITTINWFKFLLKTGFIGGITFVLASCASFYDVSVAKPAPYIKPVAIDNNFAIAGRFSIKTPTKHEYGNFIWNKTDTSEEIDFNTPLGETVAKVTVESGLVTLVTNDKTYTGDNLNQMMQEKLGFTLPFNLLHYWIQGVSLPNMPVTQQLPDGFIQLGWKVEYLQWQDKNHPQILQCSKDDLVIKLLIEW